MITVDINFVQLKKKHCLLNISLDIELYLKRIRYS